MLKAWQQANHAKLQDLFVELVTICTVQVAKELRETGDAVQDGRKVRGRNDRRNDQGDPPTTQTGDSMSFFPKTFREILPTVRSSIR